MKRRINNTDLIVTYIHKWLRSIPEFETEEEMMEWLRREVAKPKDAVFAECQKKLEEAKEELKKITYLY